MDEQKIKILEALRAIMAAFIHAMNEGRPFLFSGVIGNGTNSLPYGASCGENDQLKELKDFFALNNENMWAAIEHEPAEAPAVPIKKNYVEASIDKKEDGSVLIDFKK